MALTNKLTKIANAIRNKTGKSDSLTLDQMATEIEGISVGGSSDDDLVITDAKYLFYEGVRLDEIESLCSLIHNCSCFENMFYNSHALTTVPEFDTSNGTNFKQMFGNCEALTTLPELDLSNGTNFTSMFYNCGKLTTVPEFDTSNGTIFQQMFSNCRKLTTLPELDLSNGTNFSTMFFNCQALTTVPEFDTSNGTNMGNMFYGCYALTAIPKMDVNKCTNFTGIFYDCRALTELYLYNIHHSIQISQGSSWGKLLTVDSIVHTIKELCVVTSSQTLSMGNVSLAKIENLYCKIVDDSNEKMTMELCDSTTEGAMLITDYASEKGWQIV